MTAVVLALGTTLAVLGLILVISGTPYGSLVVTAGIVLLLLGALTDTYDQDDDDASL